MKLNSAQKDTIKTLVECYLELSEDAIALEEQIKSLYWALVNKLSNDKINEYAPISRIFYEPQLISRLNHMGKESVTLGDVRRYILEIIEEQIISKKGQIPYTKEKMLGIKEISKDNEQAFTSKASAERYYYVAVSSNLMQRELHWSGISKELSREDFEFEVLVKMCGIDALVENKFEINEVAKIHKTIKDLYNENHIMKPSIFHMILFLKDKGHSTNDITEMIKADVNGEYTLSFKDVDKHELKFLFKSMILGLDLDRFYNGNFSEKVWQSMMVLMKNDINQYGISDYYDSLITKKDNILDLIIEFEISLKQAEDLCENKRKHESFKLLIDRGYAAEDAYNTASGLTDLQHRDLSLGLSVADVQNDFISYQELRRPITPNKTEKMHEKPMSKTEKLIILTLVRVIYLALPYMVYKSAKMGIQIFKSLGACNKYFSVKR